MYGVSVWWRIVMGVDVMGVGVMGVDVVGRHHIYTRTLFCRKIVDKILNEAGIICPWSDNANW